MFDKCTGSYSSILSKKSTNGMRFMYMYMCAGSCSIYHVFPAGVGQHQLRPSFYGDSAKRAGTSATKPGWSCCPPCLLRKKGRGHEWNIRGGPIQAFNSPQANWACVMINHTPANPRASWHQHLVVKRARLVLCTPLSQTSL